MMYEWSGRFVKLLEYRSREELLKILVEQASRHVEENSVLRYHYSPYDLDFMGILYLKGTQLEIYLLNQNTMKPIRLDRDPRNILEELCNSSHGYIEVYSLNIDEYHVDMERWQNILFVNGLSLDEIRLIADLKYAVEFARKALQTYLKHETPSVESLIIDEELSRRLNDVVFRANITLNSRFKILQTNATGLWNLLKEILTSGSSRGVTVTIGKYRVWFLRDEKGKIGFTVLNDSDRKIIEGKSPSEIKDVIDKIIKDTLKEKSLVKVFVYNLEKQNSNPLVSSNPFIRKRRL